MLPWQSQKELVRGLWSSPDACRELNGVLRWSHFENPALGRIAQTCIELSTKEGLPATTGQMVLALSLLESHITKSCLDLLPEIESSQSPDAKWVVEKGREFSAHQECVILSMEMKSLAGQGKYDEIQTRVDDILSIVSPEAGTVQTEVTPEILRAWNRRLLKTVPTGVRRLDMYMKGGAYRGQSHHVLAKKSAGKGQTVTSFGASALLSGYRVHHVSLEDPLEEVQARYSHSLTGLTDDQVWARSDELAPTLKSLYSRLTVSVGKKRGFSIASLEAVLDKVKSPPDVIIVDYMQKIARGYSYSGNDATGARRVHLGQVAIDLDDIAKERNAVLWVPFQCNRQGVMKMWRKSTEAGMLDVTDYAEAYEASYPPAAIISINRSIAEEGTRYGKVYLAEHRNGVKGMVIEATMDWSMSRLRDKLEEEESQREVYIEPIAPSRGPSPEPATEVPPQ